MLYNKTVKLKDINPTTFVPTKGIDIVWSYDNNDIYGTFTTDRQQAFNDINAELSKLKIIQDSIKTYTTYNKVRPKGQLRSTLYDNGNSIKEDKS